MAITMKEIARALGVSIATVSRVLSGSEDSVSDEVRGAILEAAERMGYRPRRKVGRTVSFLIDSELFNLSSPFYSNIISGVEKEASLRRCVFQFSAVTHEDLAAGRLTIKFNDLAGVVLVGTYDAELIARLRSLRVPVVMVDFWVPTEDIDTILVDNVDGIMRAGRHLAELGHRRVAYISGTIDNISSQERRQGFSMARVSYGFSDEPALVEECAESISGGFEAMKRLLDRPDAPTAVIAYNDMVAIGALDAARQRGLAVPDDLSIVGFDDISLCSEVTPPLTTVQVPKELMGKLAVETLFHAAAAAGSTTAGAAPSTRKVLLPTRVIARGSTASPRAR